MNELQSAGTYDFIDPELAVSFELMLVIAYKRLMRVDSPNKNGVDISGLRDVQIFLACAYRNAAIFYEEEKIWEREVQEEIVQRTLKDAATFYRRERYTTRMCDTWMVKPQREVW